MVKIFKNIVKKKNQRGKNSLFFRLCAPPLFCDVIFSIKNQIKEHASLHGELFNIHPNSLLNKREKK